MPKQIVFDNKTQRLNVIRHYKRMIKWAITQSDTFMKSYAMLDAIGERYTDIYCVLCVKYNCYKCAGCPLEIAGLGCATGTKPTWYNKMVNAYTWKDFAIEAQKFLDLCIAGTYKGAEDA